MTIRLADAIRAREEQRYTEAYEILASLHDENPADARVNYQLAWLHDAQGLERAAVPWYEAAISGDLSETELRGALLGLGSTLRTLGEYQRSAVVLRRGMERFPHAGEFPAFLAMTLYNCGEHTEAMALLLKELVHSSLDEGIVRYRRAILFYQDRLDQRWTGDGEAE